MEDHHPPRDTSRAVDEAQLEALWRTGPGSRLRAGFLMAVTGSPGVTRTSISSNA